MTLNNKWLFITCDEHHMDAHFPSICRECNEWEKLRNSHDKCNVKKCNLPAEVDGVCHGHWEIGVRLGLEAAKGRNDYHERY